MATTITPEQRRQMIEGTVTAQFETITRATQGCDAMVGATALQVAAPSVAERLGIPYFFAAYCPAVLPSRRHAPPVLAALGDKPAPAMDDYSALWTQDAKRWNDTWQPLINTQRAALGLSPIDDVRGYVLTDQPWLAADATLGPWPDQRDEAVFQTGAWILPDARPLAPELEAFLEAGLPPVYFGFGSNRRVATVVHHGGAGTTTAAARAGAPQVVIPQHYDQHYWADRVHQLGLGVAHAPGTPATDSLTSALRQTLQPEVAARAKSVATHVRGDGALVAARRLVDGFPRG
jgi:vancomycin aglycone glucosyltransferase